jgi:uncharacterized membrane protein YjfL (UPF0719 family)
VLMDMDFAKASAVMLAINLLYAFLGIVIAVIGIKLVDLFFLRRVDLEEEIKKGNIAAAIFASALILGATMIIAQALGK